MKESLSKAVCQQLFTEARTHNGFLAKEVTAETLNALYDLLKWGPTSANGSPGRFVFIKSAAAKEKLLAAVAPGNIEKVKSAPVTVIIAEDREFYEKLPKLFPHSDAKSWFAGNAPLIEATAFRNSSLQGAYLMMAARALGLDCGPMSGFDAAKLDASFFSGTTWRSNFLCNLGYGDDAKLYPRLPRLDFSEACQVL